MAIGLTEQFLAGVARDLTGTSWLALTFNHLFVSSASSGMGRIKLTILSGWAISTGINRSDITSEDDLEGKSISPGISRIGRYDRLLVFFITFSTNNCLQ